jgi:hypothetical protein
MKFEQRSKSEVRLLACGVAMQRLCLHGAALGRQPSEFLQLRLFVPLQITQLFLNYQIHYILKK